MCVSPEAREKRQQECGALLQPVYSFPAPRLALLLTGCITLLLSGCGREPPKSAPLLQRGYLWQRNWTPAVAQAVSEAESRMDGVVMLGGEITWQGAKPRLLKASIPWSILRHARKPLALALRIAPFPGPFAVDDAPARAIIGAAASLLAEAREAGVPLSEFQLDFDCASQKLEGYRFWLRALRPAVRPLRIVITTLPAWLDDPGFAPLAREADGFVLQVHSVPTQQETGHAALCDTALARKWAAKASSLGLPFSIALPTYRCLAGYASDGKLLGVAMDSVQPAWPPGTRLLDFSADAGDLAALVKEWQAAPPAGLREILWYRLPVATDARNWRWPTLAAVMAGRKPAPKIEALQDGANPVDLSIANVGDADEQGGCVIAATWRGATATASEALPGWTLRVESNRAIFSPEPGSRIRLSPGDRRAIGWLRYDMPPLLRLETLQNAQGFH